MACLGKLEGKYYKSLKLVSSDYSLRSHAPLWLIWLSSSFSLSLFLLYWIKKLADCFSHSSSGSLTFRRSRWMASAPSVFVAVLLLLFTLDLVDRFFWVAIYFLSLTIRTVVWNFGGVGGSSLLFLCRKKDWRPCSPLCTMVLWRKRYVYQILAINLNNQLQFLFIYKYRPTTLETITIFTSSYSHHLLVKTFVLVFWDWFPSAGMAPPPISEKEKAKGKAPLGAISVPETNISNFTNVTNSKTLPSLKLPSGGSTSKTKAKKGGGFNPRFDRTEMFKKLAAARENGKKKKELTFVGFLVGEPKKFSRIFAKLRMEWKPMKGTLIFSVLKSGWFEVAFSNREDFYLVWENRPYHLFSQLLLLKQWYPGFEPTSESISQLDLWVRLHYLPEEFANSDALETIIEGNLVGRLLKMDPSHNSERWNLFTRFCINTDIEKTFVRGVIVPDEHLNQIKFTLWFDDFSPGCGACGKSAHTFKECPSKNSPIPTLQLTVKRPSLKKLGPASSPSLPNVDEGWNTMGINNKVVKPSNLAIPKSSIYLSEKGGINIIFESDDSEDGLQQLLENEEISTDYPNLIAVAADLHPYNIILEEKKKSKENYEKGNSSMTKVSGINQNVESDKEYKNSGSGNDATSMEVLTSKNSTANQEVKEKMQKSKSKGFPPLFSGEQMMSTSPSNNGVMDSKDKGCIKGSSPGSLKPHSSPLQPQINVINVDSQSISREEEMTEYDEEQFEYEYDDLLVDELQEELYRPNLLPNRNAIDNNAIMISDDPPFSERDLEEFINNDAMDKNGENPESEGTFHSMNNSNFSSSSFVHGMARLVVKHSDQSTSTSSKRKIYDGIEDTANSEAISWKKTKV